MSFVSRIDNFNDFLHTQLLDTPEKFIADVPVRAERLDKELEDIQDRISDVDKRCLEYKDSIHGEVRDVIMAHGGLDDISELSSIVKEFYEGEGQVRYQDSDSKFSNLSRVGASMCLGLLLERETLSPEAISKIAGMDQTKVPDLNTYVNGMIQRAKRMVKDIAEPSKGKEQENGRDM